MKNQFALLARFTAQEGKEEEVKSFLEDALPLVNEEAGTNAWFALRFEDSTFGIFDTFSTEADRDAHLSGPIAEALMDRAPELFRDDPDIQKIDLLAEKFPDSES